MASNVFPQPGSIWYIPPDFPAPPTFDYSKENIDPSLENSEIFVKYSTMTSKIDFEIMGAYTWDDFPTMHVEKQFDMSSGSPVLTGLNITPEHHRLSVGGGSFSTEIFGVVLRGEAAYYNGKYFQTEDPLQLESIIQKDYLHYLVGLDFIIGGVNLSTQFIQQTILDYDKNILNEELNQKIRNRMDYLFFDLQKKERNV